MDEKSHLAYRAHAQKALYYGDVLIQEPQFVPCEIRQEPAAAALQSVTVWKAKIH